MRDLIRIVDHGTHYGTEVIKTKEERRREAGRLVARAREAVAQWVVEERFRCFYSPLSDESYGEVTEDHKRQWIEINADRVLFGEGA